ncbi:hypothetical protein D3C77_768930 [compost metagenome]
MHIAQAKEAVSNIRFATMRALSPQLNVNGLNSTMTPTPPSNDPISCRRESDCRKNNTAIGMTQSGVV